MLTRPYIPKALAEGPYSEINNWSVSLKFKQNPNGWIWPNNSEEAEILRFVCRLTNKSWVELQNLRYGNGSRSLLKMCDSLNLDPILQNQLNNLFAGEEANSFSTDWVFEFTYCSKNGDPRRLLGVLSDSVFYILWWDKDHKAFGRHEDLTLDSSPCREECLH